VPRRTRRTKTGELSFRRASRSAMGDGQQAFPKPRSGGRLEGSKLRPNPLELCSVSNRDTAIYPAALARFEAIRQNPWTALIQGTASPARSRRRDSQMPGSHAAGSQLLTRTSDPGSTAPTQKPIAGVPLRQLCLELFSRKSAVFELGRGLRVGSASVGRCRRHPGSPAQLLTLVPQLPIPDSRLQSVALLFVPRLSARFRVVPSRLPHRTLPSP
jgi:hypothetical protein